jgi:hypothetical protein
MEHCAKKPGDEKEIPAFGPDSIEMAMRLRIRDTIEELVKQELDAALGAVKSARVGETREGYRHGTRERTLTTSLGPTTIAMPRARMRGAAGTSGEWRSETVRRYQRRTTRVDEAILGVYLAGGNTRRIKGALAPLLRAGRCRRMRCPGWSGASARTSRRGVPAISPTKTSATCSWTAGIPRCGSAAAASAFPCW